MRYGRGRSRFFLASRKVFRSLQDRRQQCRADRLCVAFLHPGRAAKWSTCNRATLRARLLLRKTSASAIRFRRTPPLALWSFRLRRRAAAPRDLQQKLSSTAARRKISRPAYFAAAAPRAPPPARKNPERKGMRTALELPLRLEEERGNLRNYLFMVCVCQRA